MYRLTTLGKEWEQAITWCWAMPSKYCARERWAMYPHYLLTADLERLLYLISLYLPRFGVICDLLLHRRPITWNLFLKMLLTWYRTCISLLDMSALVSGFWQANSSVLGSWISLDLNPIHDFSSFSPWAEVQCDPYLHTRRDFHLSVMCTKVVNILKDPVMTITLSRVCFCFRLHDSEVYCTHSAQCILVKTGSLNLIIW